VPQVRKECEQYHCVHLQNAVPREERETRLFCPVIFGTGREGGRLRGVRVAEKKEHVQANKEQSESRGLKQLGLCDANKEREQWVKAA
jgi:hypothetical protein